MLAPRLPDPLRLLVDERRALDDMERLADPSLGLLVPPRIVVVERHARPALDGLLDAAIALAVVRPAEELHHLVPRERDGRAREVVLELRKLDEGHEDLIVDGRREPIGVAAGDGHLADDGLAQLAVAGLDLEDQRLAALRDAVAQEGDGELGEVQLISSPERLQGLPRILSGCLGLVFHALIPMEKQQPRCCCFSC